MKNDARRIPLVVAALGIAAALIATFFLVERSPVVPSTAPSSGGDRGAAAASADLPGDPDQRTVSTSSREEVAVTPARFDPADDQEGRRVNVQLLDAVTREPVVGAVVHYADPDWSWRDFSPVESDRLQDLRTRDLESFLLSNGHRTESDTSGRCAVPAERSSVEVVARKGGMFGSTVIDYDQGTDRVILMHEDVTLGVTVVDYQGRAAPRVQIVAYPRADTPPRERALLGRADENGSFSVLHFHALAADLESGQIVLAATVAGGESDRVVVNPSALPPDGVSLQLPPTGSWTFHVTDAQGVALPGGDQMGSQLVILAPVGQPRPTWYRRLDARSTCRFDHVVLDARFDANVFRAHRELDLAGPTRDAPDLITQIRMPEDALILHGRAVDEAGQVLADDTMQNITHQVGERPEFFSARTNDEGYFAWVVLDRNPDKELPIELRLWPDNDLDTEFKHYLSLPRGLPPGDHDLGDLRFDAGPLIARGRVELVDGGVPEPVILSVRAEVDGQPAMVVGATTWPEPGVFEIRGASPTEELRLAVADVRYQGTGDIPFRAGDTDLFLRITPRGELTANFLVDEGAPWNMCRYFLEPRFEPTRQRMTEAFRLERAGDRVVTTWRGLEVGTYDLFVRVPGLAEPVVHIGDLEVTGGPVEDPRLDGIELDPGTRTVSVTLVDTDGNPIADGGAGLIVTNPDSSVSPGLLPASEGVVDVLLVDWVVARAIAPGYLPKDVRVNSDTTVALDPAPELSLTVKLPGSLPDRATARLTISPSENNPLHGAAAVGYRNDPSLAVGGFTHRAVRVATRGPAPRSQRLSPGQLTFDLDSVSELDLQLEQPGDYQVRLELVAGRNTADLDLGDQSTLRWGGTRAEAVVIEVRPAAFQKALDEVRN